MSEPHWLAIARGYIGVKEIPGPRENSTIQMWLKRLNSWIKSEEVPWCGTFVAHCFDAVSIKPTKHWYRAKDWLNWGVSVPPRLGVVGVFDRKGGGHVGFLVGETATHYAVLGGNQGNAVNVMNLQKNRLLGCRWPEGVAKSPVMPLPRLAGIIGNGNEA